MKIRLLVAIPVALVLLAVALSICSSFVGYLDRPNLARAAYDGDAQAVSQALDRGIDANRLDWCDVRWKDFGNAMPLVCWAAAGNQPEVIRLLHRRGADMDGTPSGERPLKIALAMGSDEAAAALVELGADCRWTDPDGKCPLELAVDWHRIGAIPSLIEAKAKRDSAEAITDYLVVRSLVLGERYDRFDEVRDSCVAAGIDVCKVLRARSEVTGSSLRTYLDRLNCE